MIATCFRAELGAIGTMHAVESGMLNPGSHDSKVGHAVSAAWSSMMMHPAMLEGDAGAFTVVSEHGHLRLVMEESGVRDDVAQSVDPFDPGALGECRYPYGPSVLAKDRHGRQYRPCLSTYLTLAEAAEALRDEPDPADDETSFAAV